MKVILREDTSGVSEVIGTILILSMTVVLFSVIIIWVSNIPTPVAQTRLDIRSQLDPIYSAGVEVGVNITLTHQGGEALQPVPTLIYVTSQRGTNPPQTVILTLHRFNAILGNGLLDGTDSIWDIGERWEYQNFALRSSDAITVTVVDTVRSLVLWTAPMNAPQGTRPPVFIDKWADGIPSTDAIDPVQATLGFGLYAKVTDPDGDLNPNSVFATITAWYGSGTSCQQPQRMYDDGPLGGHGDKVAGDSVFTLVNNVCINPPYPALSWAGSIILLNATDMQGHQTTTRLVLNVVPQTTGGGTSLTTIPSSLWQYIGFVQIRTGEVWISNLSDSQGYNSASRYQPYRVTKALLNGNGGALFHFKMANHGNTTIFIDGYTQAFFVNTQSASGAAIFITAPCDPTIAPNAGGVAAYPGIPSITDFQYAHAGLPSGCKAGVPNGVFDINPLNQETGGTPYVVMAYPKGPFTTGSANNWANVGTYYLSILVSGMAGPTNYTYTMLTGTGQPNPYGCSGLGANYNPLNHISDPIVACRTTWYAQVIPFVGMTIVG
jgi:Archaeal Type IV pilin, N-terminal